MMNRRDPFGWWYGEHYAALDVQHLINQLLEDAAWRGSFYVT